jgi:hypothetical protein
MRAPRIGVSGNSGTRKLRPGAPQVDDSHVDVERLGWRLAIGGATEFAGLAGSYQRASSLRNRVRTAGRDLKQAQARAEFWIALQYTDQLVDLPDAPDAGAVQLPHER